MSTIDEFFEGSSPVNIGTRSPRTSVTRRTSISSTAAFTLEQIINDELAPPFSLNGIASR